MTCVLHINDYRGGGGAEVVIETTIRLLAERGVHAELFTIEEVPGHRRSGASYLRNRRAMAALRLRLERVKPDIVHLHNFYHELSPAILETLRDWKQAGSGRRVVMTAHDFHLVCPNAGLCVFRRGRLEAADPERIRSWGFLLANRWDHRGLAYSWLKLVQHVVHYRWKRSHRAIDLVLCPSVFMQRMIGKTGLPTQLLANPVSTSGERMKMRRGERLRMVYAGRVEPEKGIAEFLGMLNGHGDLEMTVIGDGAAMARCQQVSAAHSGSMRVQYRGRLTHEDTLAEIASAHVLVLPSLCVENAPNALIEALANGTNILTSDIGGMKEIVDGAGVGFTFTPNNPASLRMAMDSIRTAFEAGTLNAFDVGEFLAARGPAAYVDGLLSAYGCSPHRGES